MTQKAYITIFLFILYVSTQHAKPKRNIPGIILGSIIISVSGIMTVKYGLLAFLAHCTNAHSMRNKALAYTAGHTSCCCVGWALLYKSAPSNKSQRHNHEDIS